jgi:phosphoglycerate dehydrogenase-like enzyme
LLSAAVAWIAGTAPVSADHLERAPNLRVVVRYGTGTEAVDVNAAEARGILVANTPGANAAAVADLTVGLILSVLRHVVDGDRAVRAGKWPALRGRELGALTVGIVGFGQIGRAVAQRLRGGFGSRLVVCDPFVDANDICAAGAEFGGLDDVLAAADVLTLHAPGGGPALVDSAALKRIRKGAIIVNTARAELLDEDAVAAALVADYLGGVAVDVSSAGSPLLTAPRVVVTPHLGAQTVEAVDRMGMWAAEEVVRVLRGEPPLHRVSASGSTA